MLNKYLLISGCLLTLANYAQATDSVDLKVTGKLVSGSCTPTLENGGVVDFGHVPLGNLSKTEVNRIGQKKIILSITCSSVMPLGWHVKDNRPDSLVDQAVPNAFYTGGHCLGGPNKFGLGKTAGGVNIGAYCVGVDVPQATVDGINGDLIYKNIGAGASDSWEKSSEGATRNLSPEDRYLTLADIGSLTPKAGKVFVYPLRVTASIQGTDVLAITDNTNLDGSATISLVYL
ncbi:TPA: DUF1120 domain-containing protein [Citrobacter farmeri]|nr:DUF1120 domain-containing protein [Citrobacter farmeri]